MTVLTLLLVCAFLVWLIEFNASLAWFQRKPTEPAKPQENLKMETDPQRWIKSFEKHQCPDCGSRDLREGPSGGMCTNIYCGSCGSGFNVGPGLCERITAPCEKSQSYFIGEGGPDLLRRIESATYEPDKKRLVIQTDEPAKNIKAVAILGSNALTPEYGAGIHTDNHGRTQEYWLRSFPDDDEFNPGDWLIDGEGNLYTLRGVQVLDPSVQLVSPPIQCGLCGSGCANQATCSNNQIQAIRSQPRFDAGFEFNDGGEGNFLSPDYADIERRLAASGELTTEYPKGARAIRFGTLYGMSGQTLHKRLVEKGLLPSRFERVLRKLFRYSTAGPALTRYYILPRVKLHRIHSSDTDFHTHPWNGLSIIFGSYQEDRNITREDGTVHKGSWKRKGFNWVSANVPHLVTVSKPVWTLFLHGPKVNPEWQYGDTTKPWEGSDYERARKEARNERTGFLERAIQEHTPAIVQRLMENIRHGRSTTVHGTVTGRIRSGGGPNRSNVPQAGVYLPDCDMYSTTPGIVPGCNAYCVGYGEHASDCPNLGKVNPFPTRSGSTPVSTSQNPSVLFGASRASGKPPYAETDFEHRLVWGVDRRDQGPLELRQLKATDKRRAGPVEWRYQPLSVEENREAVARGERNQEDWDAEPIPAEIAGMFPDGSHVHSFRPYKGNA